MRVIVIDGQGGGLGRSLVEKLVPIVGNGHRLTVYGTNSMATVAMLKAGANEGATGENAIVVGAAQADIIVGAVGILLADSMLGELTPSMARAIADSRGTKVLVPLNRCGVVVAGVSPEKTVAQLVTDAAETVACMLK
ncbi:DUF3842 family protein [Oscillospiraceae bacterium MB08-C2-2]|nr:DUF3842 family protein [Oscillospiraceae bacterium MB08-C2-2]